MITPELVKIIYNAASIKRWNDYPRMVDLTELDKQAHKFVIAYFLASFEEDVDFLKMVEIGIFEFFQRVIVTDIRPDVFREIIKEKENELNFWVLKQLKPAIKGIDNREFINRLEEHFLENRPSKEREILQAAHYLATRWEFNIVYESSKFLPDIDELKHSIEEDLQKFKHLKGVVELEFSSKLTKLFDLFGRLRFQIRWAQTPRVPTTSVLGHMLVVALFSYFYSISINPCDKRVVNNFFTALFHDLPEALTRDIISPVKRSVKGLEEIILDVEIKRIKTIILPLVPSFLHEEFTYLLGLFDGGDGYKKDEFKNRIMISAMVQAEDNLEKHNKNEDNPIDGVALKACDDLAAFTEAAISIGHGIKSRELKNAIIKCKKKYENIEIYNLDMSETLLEMEEYLTKID